MLIAIGPYVEVTRTGSLRTIARLNTRVWTYFIVRRRLGGTSAHGTKPTWCRGRRMSVVGGRADQVRIPTLRPGDIVIPRNWRLAHSTQYVTYEIRKPADGTLAAQ